ncbi:MAG: hypothetical protein N2B02_05080, partial [Amylibacter sp.]
GDSYGLSSRRCANVAKRRIVGAAATAAVGLLSWGLGFHLLLFHVSLAVPAGSYRIKNHLP